MADYNNNNYKRQGHEFPYVSTYYYNPTPKAGTSITIPLYITDYFQQEYAYNDNSEKFTLRYEVDGQVKTIADVPAGDYDLVLGALSPGEHWFSVQVTDSHGYSSFRLYNELLVKSSSANSYTVKSSDLTNNNITINLDDSASATQMQNNRVGLTNLFASLKNQGYTKCVLPQGTYRVNKAIREATNNDTPISIPSGFTVDLNGSTIKMHVYDDTGLSDSRNSMIRFQDCIDSHIINGTLEGNYAERQSAGFASGYNGEGDGCIYVNGGKYNTVENLTIKQIAGYNLSHNFGSHMYMEDKSSATWNDNTFVDSNGNNIAKGGYTTSEAFNLSSYKPYGWICASIWLRTGGLKGKHWQMFYHFYNGSTFIETIPGCQFRRCRIPDNATSVKVSFICQASEVGTVYLHTSPNARYCAVKNVEMIDNRTCMNPNQFQHLRYENINFTRSGQSITPAEIDLEDGWEQAQDFYVYNCKVLESAGAGDIIAQSGQNFVIEKCDGLSITRGAQVFGSCIRDNSNLSIGLDIGKHTKNTTRVYNNTNVNDLTSGGFLYPDQIVDKDYIKCVVKNCTIKQGNYTPGQQGFKDAVNNIIIDGGTLEIINTYRNLNVRNATVKIGGGCTQSNTQIFTGCTFELAKGVKSIDINIWELDATRVYRNCTFNAPVNIQERNYWNNGIWENCTFNHDVVITMTTSRDNSYGDIAYNYCNFAGNLTINNNGNTKVQFEGCTLPETITYNGTAKDNTKIIATVIAFSNTFTITVNRATQNEGGVDGDIYTRVYVYKGGEPLTCVAGTPDVGQFSIAIDSTDGCTGGIIGDKVYVDTLSKDKATIVINVTLPNGDVIKKYFNINKSLGSTTMKEVTTRTSKLEQNLDGFKMTVSETYATQDSLNVVDSKFNNYSTTKQMNSAITQKANEITSTVSETYATKTDLNTVDGKFNDYSTTTQMNSAITQRANSILSTVSETYATKDSIDSIIAGDINLENYPTTIQMNSAINQKANEITSTVSQTYATKTALKDTDDKFADYSTTTQMNSAINQKANEITSTVSETYATKTTTNNMLSQIQQNANSISTKVDVNGVISSINQSSETISINANKINLNGYVSNDNANWSIDNEGNMKAENLKIEGEAGADTLSVNYIDNPCYPATLAGSVHLYVNANTGNDDYTIDDILQSYDEAEEQNNDTLKKKFKTLQGALDASPAFLNNKNLRITLETNTTEDVYVRGFTSGAVRIYLNGKTIYGNVHGYANSATVYLYGGTVDDTTATQGVIHPNIGFNFSSRCVSAGFDACQYVALYKVKVFGADNKPSDISSNHKVAVASASGTGSIYCSDVQITNCAIGFRANNMGCIHVAKSSGKASRYGFESTTGGQISIADGNQAGGATANTSESSGGQVWFKSPTFDGNTTSTDTTTAPSTSTTKVMTIKSSYGDTYRSSVYDNWKKDGTVRQGDYGYGDCTGCWFFGTAFSELKGKTITKVQITIKRQTGGSSVPVEHKLWMHGHTVRPSGAPKLTSGWSQTFRLATGNSTTVLITNSAVLNAISAGTCKGFALRNTYDSAHYSVCSGSVTVKITYTE